jgi:aminoglycoside phosphotransferase
MDESNSPSITAQQVTARPSLSTPQENKMAKINSDFINLFSNIVEQSPSVRLMDAFRIHGDKYVRAVRKIYWDTNEEVGVAEDSGHVAVRKQLSFVEMVKSGSGRVKVNNLVNLVKLINDRCSQNMDPQSLTSKYLHVTTKDLVSRVSSGDNIWSLSGRDVVKIDENLVAKCGPTLETLEEAANMQFIRQLTSIPVPEIVRVHAQGREAYIFMSYIPGSTLQDIWPTLGTEERHNITDQLKTCMDELRAVPPPSPCYFGSLETHICIDRRQFTRLNIGRNKRISSEAEFNTFIMTDLWHTYPPEYCNMVLSMMRQDHRVVLTHGDLHPRNIMVKDMVVTGIIDWECAGWYPEYWEYVKALTSVGPVVDWWRYISTIIDPYYSEWAIDRQFVMR